MDPEENARFYSRRALQELSLAASAISPTIKILHLNMAAHYATMRERAMPPHFAGQNYSEAAVPHSARSKLLLQAAMSRAFLNNPVHC
jgi:hypothetical protein